MTVLLVLIIVVFILTGIVYVCKCNRNSNKHHCKKCTDDFSNDFSNEMYSKYETNLDDIKKNFEIGAPSGVLSYNPKDKSCEAENDENELVQSNVAFKSVKHRDGCTFVEKKYN